MKGRSSRPRFRDDPHPLVTRAEKVRYDMSTALGILADERLKEWRKEFRTRWPRLHGRILFGNGVEVAVFGKGKTEVTVGMGEFEDYHCLAGLKRAIDDVCDITENYHLGCPEDMRF